MVIKKLAFCNILFAFFEIFQNNLKNYTMKRLSTFSLTLLISVSLNSQEVKVVGNISGLTAPSIVFRYRVSNLLKSDTVIVKNEKFVWYAKISTPKRVNIIISHRIVDFFAEEGTISLTGQIDSLEYLKFVGSQAQNEFETYISSIKDIVEQEKKIGLEFGSGIGIDENRISKEFDNLKAQKLIKMKQFIISHPKSIVSISLVDDEAWASAGDYNDAKSVFDLLDETVQQSEEGKDILDGLKILKRSSIGEPMLNFTLNNLDGSPVQFSNFLGKYILVEFWASWCHPCRAENPNLLKAYEKYGSKNFTIVGISLDEDKERWRKAIQDDKISWIQVSDLKGYNNEVASYFGIYAIPYNFLVDPEGRIIARDLRGEALNRKLKELFN